MGPFIHNIDPIITNIGGVYLWWYGFSYTLGFTGMFLWLRCTRNKIHLDLGKVYSLSISIFAGVLLGARLIEVFFYEWSYYRNHFWHIPAYWLGGMSTHGILLGAILGVLIFCKRNRTKFLEIADELVIPGAFLMGVGRIGNFIDGQILGSVTDVWWAVKFPDVIGYRHPVVLYDGLKNLLIIPVLLIIRKKNPPKGILLGNFIWMYGFFRIFVDFFREYRISFWGLPPGQGFNIFMTILGIFMVFYLSRRSKEEKDALTKKVNEEAHSGILKRLILIFLILFPLISPSDWTQDIPKRYGKRHQGLKHSKLYPQIER